MLRLKWTTYAVEQFELEQRYYENLNPMAASLLAMRVNEATMRLCEMPGIGRVGNIAGTREWVVQKTPYVLVYRERDDALEVLYLWHAAQAWQRND